VNSRPVIGMQVGWYCTNSMSRSGTPWRIGQRHAVAGDDAAVGVFAEDAAGTAGGDDDRLAFDQREFAGAHLDGHDALDAAVFFDQINAEMLVEALDRRVLDRGLEQGVQHVEAGLVGGKPGALDLHAAEGAHVDVAIRRCGSTGNPSARAGSVLRCSA
jgi:hypothetical protein